MEKKQRYKELCDKEQTICIFDQPWWLDAVCGKDNWDVELYFKGESIVASMVYYKKRKHGLSYITQPQLTQHNGIWIKYPKVCKYQTKLALELEATQALINRIEAQKDIVYYQQAMSPSCTNILPFYWNGFEQSVRYTYRICHDDDYEKIFSGFSKRLRKNILNARGKAIVFETDNIEILKDLQDLTYQRQGLSSPLSLDFLKRFDKVVCENKSRKILCAKDENGNICCATYIVFDNAWVYQIMSGSNPEYRHNAFKSLLEEKSIKYAMETNRGFDFEGSMVPGIEEHNRQFGAIQTPYYVLKKVYAKNPLIKYTINRIRSRQ